ncbi:MAG: hypothetical protein ACK4M7_01145, partial [Burkholderiales bacterium]
MTQNINSLCNIKPINKTEVKPGEKPQVLNDLNKYVESYVRKKILYLNFSNNEAEKNKFIAQCKIACKLAVKVIQEGKNHKGTVTFTNLDYYGELVNAEAKNLFNLLVGRPNSEVNEENRAADNLDKLCKHSNTIITNRKLSFWGTNYTHHAEKFRQFIDKLEVSVAVEPKTVGNGGYHIINSKLENFSLKRQVLLSLFIATETKFSGSTSFSECEFKGGLIFSNVSFMPDIIDTIDFGNTIFDNKVDFSSTKIYSKAETHIPKISFRNAEFRDSVDLGSFRDEGIVVGTKNSHLGLEIDLTGVKIQDGKYINFSTVADSLSNCTIKLNSSILRHIKNLEMAYSSSSSTPTRIIIDGEEITNREELLHRLEKAADSFLAKNGIQFTEGKLYNLKQNLCSWISEAPDREKQARKAAAFQIQEAHNKKLAALNLNYLGLTTLPDGVFNGLSNLTLLNLSHNQLSTLPDGVLNDLTNLAWLNLSYNRFSTLPSRVFSGSTKLRRLDISYNPLSTLPAEVFDGLSNLIRLGLSDHLPEED